MDHARQHVAKQVFAVQLSRYGQINPSRTSRLANDRMVLTLVAIFR
jgi:hypothetical protein